MERRLRRLGRHGNDRQRCRARHQVAGERRARCRHARDERDRDQPLDRLSSASAARGLSRRVQSEIERTGIGTIPKPLVARSVACRMTATPVAACHSARASANPAVATHAALSHGHRSAIAALAVTTESDGERERQHDPARAPAGDES